LKWPVGLVGAAYLIWLSWDSWKAASIAFSVNENQDEKARSGLKSATDRFASK
jgi:chemosensory pili system protein ChpE/L-lysine exporter family protein LysE/ArgO